MICFNLKATSTNNTNYNCHILSYGTSSINDMVFMSHHIILLVINTINRERFAGLNIHSFSLMKFFTEILSQYLDQQCLLFILSIHAETFVVLSKTAKV